MFINLPSSFPKDRFLEFGLLAAGLFPKLLSNEHLSDLNVPHPRRLHLDRSWMAVAYRYRSCAEHNEEFKALLNDASELWKEWGSDEEQNYKLERCLYGFFMNGLSIFESFVFCLNFVGDALQPGSFPNVNAPKKIKLENTVEAFKAAFPHLAITTRLAALAQQKDYQRIDGVRNILAHRLGGRRNVSSSNVVVRDGTFNHTRKEVWHLPGMSDELIFDEEMTQRCLNGITNQLTSLVEASIELLQQKNLRKAPP